MYPLCNPSLHPMVSHFRGEMHEPLLDASPCVPRPSGCDCIACIAVHLHVLLHLPLAALLACVCCACSCPADVLAASSWIPGGSRLRTPPYLCTP